MMDAVRMVLAVNSPLDCKHNPIVLDESPSTAAPSLVVCSLCGEIVEGEAHESPKLTLDAETRAKLDQVREHYAHEIRRFREMKSVGTVQ